MKELSFDKIRSLTGTQLWLLGTGAGLITVHVTIANRFGDSSFFILSLLFWLAVVSLIQQKSDRLTFNSGVFPSLLGLLLLAVLLLRSLGLPTLNFLGIYPFLAGLGLALLASGFKGLKQYWRELTILFFLGVPKAILGPIFDISIFTAKFATGILWYSGQDVSRQLATVALPGGAVNVFIGCSGLEGVFYLLGLSILALLMYPLQGRKRFFVPIVAVAIAFVVNGFRVVLMALLANAKDQKALDYWHVGNGSLIFSLIAVMLFGFFYLFLLQREPVIDPDAGESELS